MSRVLLLALLAALLLFPTAARAGASDVVVSQIYGGGGNAGATFRNERHGRRPHFRGRSRPAATTSSSSHRTRTSAPPSRLRTRPARATSAAPVGRSRSFVGQLRSRAALRRGVARPTRSWRISSATAARATSRVPARRRGFPTLRRRFARTTVALTQATTRRTLRRRPPRPGTPPPRTTCAQARLPLGRPAP